MNYIKKSTYIIVSHFEIVLNLRLSVKHKTTQIATATSRRSTRPPPPAPITNIIGSVVVTSTVGAGVATGVEVATGVGVLISIV